MKKKIMALVMSAAVMLCMCGCDMKDFAQPFKTQIGLGVYSDFYKIEIKETDSKIINKCFEKIQIGPAVLTLPVNVSDLPEEISLSIDDASTRESHNGFKTVFAVLELDENDIGYAGIFCADEENYTDGVVMSLTVFASEVNAVFGDVSFDMGLDEIDRAMGYSGDYSVGCIYASSDGKAIFMDRLDFARKDTNSNYDIERADFVCLLADPEFWILGD